MSTCIISHVQRSEARTQDEPLSPVYEAASPNEVHENSVYTTLNIGADNKAEARGSEVCNIMSLSETLHYFMIQYSLLVIRYN